MEEKRTVPEVSLVETADGVVETIAATDECHGRDKKLGQLRGKINRSWGQCEKLYLDIGNDLLEAKGLFGKYGEWQGWLKANIPFSVRQAQRLMRVAEWLGKTTPVSHLEFSKAYILTRIPRARMKDFLEKLKVESAGEEPFQVIQSMGKRDLERAVRNYLLSSTAVSNTRKEQKHEVSSPAKSLVDSALDELCHLEDTMSGLVKNIMNRQMDDAVYDTLISEIRRLCEDTLGKLPTEDVELG